MAVPFGELWSKALTIVGKVNSRDGRRASLAEALDVADAILDEGPTDEEIEEMIRGLKDEEFLGETSP